MSLRMKPFVPPRMFVSPPDTVFSQNLVFAVSVGTVKVNVKSSAVEPAHAIDFATSRSSEYLNVTVSFNA